MSDTSGLTPTQEGADVTAAAVLEKRQRLAIADAISARRAVEAAVRRRRIVCRWIAGASLLTWLPLGALVSFDAATTGLQVWAVGASLAVAAATLVHAREHRARSRARAAVARISGEAARRVLRESGSMQVTERRDLMSVILPALDHAPADLLPSDPPAGGETEVTPARASPGGAGG